VPGFGSSLEGGRRVVCIIWSLGYQAPTTPTRLSPHPIRSILRRRLIPLPPLPIPLSLAILQPSNRHPINLTLRLQRRRHFRALLASLNRDERIIVPRHDTPKQNHNDRYDRENETRDHHRVVAQRVEFRERKGEDDCEDRAGDVA
jgi:hypothetical protein